tara:strand:+ start:922 stop:1332 length:411 start_codon:yes stop_codon:yes gene_type:complete
MKNLYDTILKGVNQYKNNDGQNMLKHLMQVSGNQVGRNSDEPVYYTGEAGLDNNFYTLASKTADARARTKMIQSPQDSLSIGDVLTQFPFMKEEYSEKPNILNYLENYKESELEGLKGRKKRKKANMLDNLLNYFK